MNTMTSRRHFLGAIAATAVGADGLARLLALEPASDSIHLGMMLQGASAADLQEQARNIASVGFDTVQLTFFFHPTLDELKKLSETMGQLKLRVAALGTYFNLFRLDDTSFMRSSQATMKLLAAQAELFGCKQFVTWSASHSLQFAGSDPRNQTPDAVAQVQRAIREILLPIVVPMGGRIAFEPYYPHVLGTLELAKEILAPFPVERIGLLLDPPNFISPDLYPKREEGMRRLFRELGDRIHLVHFKDMKLNSTGRSVDLPGPGGGEMNYPLLISELRKLDRPLDCIIEHIKPEAAEMSKTKAWVEKQLRQP
jgi:sugar phosphate isomerase/epimerase